MNSNKNKIQLYLNQLKTDFDSKSKYKQRYQIKILQLLIESEQSKLAYDGLNIKYIQLKRNNQKLSSQITQLTEKIQAAEDDKNQLDFQVKGYKLQISKLQENKQQINSQILQLKSALNAEKQKYNLLLAESQNKHKTQLSDLNSKIGELKQQNTSLFEENRRIKQNQINREREYRKQIQGKQKESKCKIQDILGQCSIKQKKITKQYNDRLQNVNRQSQNYKILAEQQKQQLNKCIQRLQLKLKNVEKQISQIYLQKNTYEISQQQLSKDIKQKQKQIKTLKKQNTQMAEQINQLKQQNQQIKQQLSTTDLKRKQLAKRQMELKKQLQQKNQQFMTQNQMLLKQKENIRDLKQQISKLKQNVQVSDKRIRELQSNLYKSNLIVEQDKKKLQEAQIKIEFMETANINLNKKIAFEQNNKQSIVKAIMGQKQWAQKQNIKLLQLLQIKQNTIRAILDGLSDIEMPKLADLGISSQTKQNWANLMKQNLKDEATRKKAIDKFLLN